MIRFSLFLVILCSLGAQVYSAPEERVGAIAKRCVTVQSNVLEDSVRECQFPFKHDGKTYRSCTTDGSTNAWCAYEVDGFGDAVLNKWADCDRNYCNIPGSDPDTWGPVGPPGSDTISLGPAGRPGYDSDTWGPPICKTKRSGGGNKGNNKPCVFPFRHLGNTYNSCTTDLRLFGGDDNGAYWCSTKTNRKGKHISGKGHYGFCPETDACLCNDRIGSCPSSRGTGIGSSGTN